MCNRVLLAPHLKNLIVSDLEFFLKKKSPNIVMINFLLWSEIRLNDELESSSGAQKRIRPEMSHTGIGDPVINARYMFNFFEELFHLRVLFCGFIEPFFPTIVILKKKLVSI